MTRFESSLLFYISVGIVDNTIRHHIPRAIRVVRARRENKKSDRDILYLILYGAAAGTRIPDSQIKSLILYQLSYSNTSYTYVSLIYRFLHPVGIVNIVTVDTETTTRIHAPHTVVARDRRNINILLISTTL